MYFYTGDGCGKGFRSSAECICQFLWVYWCEDEVKPHGKGWGCSVSALRGPLLLVALREVLAGAFLPIPGPGTSRHLQGT